MERQGVLSTHAPNTYKIPTAADVPEIFNVSLVENSPNPRGHDLPQQGRGRAAVHALAFASLSRDSRRRRERLSLRRNSLRRRRGGHPEAR